MCSSDLLLVSATLSVFARPEGWPIEAGLGGSLGDEIAQGLVLSLGLGLKRGFAEVVAVVLLGLPGLMSFISAAGLTRQRRALMARVFGDNVDDTLQMFAGWLSHLWLMMWSLMTRRLKRRAIRPAPQRVAAPRVARRARTGFWRRLFSVGTAQGDSGRIEPMLSAGARAGVKPRDDENASYREAGDAAAEDDEMLEDEEADEEAEEEAEEEDAEDAAPVRVSRSNTRKIGRAHV